MPLTATNTKLHCAIISLTQREDASQTKQHQQRRNDNFLTRVNCCKRFRSFVSSIFSKIPVNSVDFNDIATITSGLQWLIVHALLLLPAWDHTSRRRPRPYSIGMITLYRRTKTKRDENGEEDEEEETHARENKMGTNNIEVSIWGIMFQIRV